MTSNHPSTVINAGTVSGQNYGIRLAAGGTVDNSGTITGTSFYSYGVRIDDGNVTNESGGTIIGASGIGMRGFGGLGS